MDVRFGTKRLEQLFLRQFLQVIIKSHIRLLARLLLHIQSWAHSISRALLFTFICFLFYNAISSQTCSSYLEKKIIKKRFARQTSKFRYTLPRIGTIPVKLDCMNRKKWNKDFQISIHVAGASQLLPWLRYSSQFFSRLKNVHCTISSNDGFEAFNVTV